MAFESEFYIETEHARLHSRLAIPSSVHAPGSMSTATQGLFIICHGLLDTKYAPLFSGLQNMLPFASLAFDFRGNGLSSGQTSYGSYLDEAQDIKSIVDYVNSGRIDGYQFKIVGLVGHSKGASSALLFACKYPHLCPPLLVTISARYFMSRELPDRWKPQQMRDLKDRGRFLWRTYGGQTIPSLTNTSEAAVVPKREYWVTAHHLSQRNSTDMSIVRTLPLNRCFVLNVMGGGDTVVPEEDVWEYDRIMRLSAPDTTRVTTSVVPGASHFWSATHELGALQVVVNSWLNSVLPLAKL